MPPPSKGNATSRRRERVRQLGITNNWKDFQWVCARTERVNIVAVGDSWLSYPPEYLVAGPNSNIVDWLYDWLQPAHITNILRQAANGDEAVEMTRGRQFRRTTEVVARCQPDLLLFSAGGNDVVGKYDLPGLLNTWQPGFTAGQCLDLPAFDARMADVLDGYRRLLTMVASASPDTTVVGHSYDLPQPSRRGARFLWGIEFTKPWIYHYLMEKGIPRNLHRPVVQLLLGRFDLELPALMASHSNFRVARTLGTLTPGSRRDWLNEIHPTRSGFRQIAALIHDEMRAAVPQLPAIPN